MSEKVQLATGFEADRMALIRLANDLAGITASRGDKVTSPEALALAEKIRTARLNLVVIGEFKRGKSTFVNALLGTPLLPMAVVPLTSIVTVIGYADKPQATVKFNDGSTKRVSIESISEYITESGNPENEKGVKIVEIEYPAAIVRPGVRIVDTPGTGSVYEHNTEATRQYLPEADALIFLLTADQPASRAELDLLQEARQYASRCFVVQNKVDYLDDEQRLQSLDFLHRMLSPEFPEPIHIYPISARAALNRQQNESGEFQSLHEDIVGFLHQEKGNLLISNSSVRLSKLLKQAEEFVALESRMTEMSTAAIEENIAKFRMSAGRIVSAQKEVKHLLGDKTDELIENVGSHLKKFVSDRKLEMLTVIDAEFEANKRLNNFRLIKILSIKLREEIEKAFREWRREEEFAVKNAFQSITEEFNQRATEIVTDVEKLTTEIFGSGISAEFEVEPLTEKTRHYYFTENPFPADVSQLILVLPGLKTYIKNKFLGIVELELSRNAERLRFDIKERIESSSREFVKKFRHGVESVIGQVEEALRATATQLAESRAKGERIERSNASHTARLAALRQELDRVAGGPTL